MDPASTSERVKRETPPRRDRPMTKSTTILVTANADADDCLTDAVDSFVADHPDLAGWDLSPRWADESREQVALTVPAWSLESK